MLTLSLKLFDNLASAALTLLTLMAPVFLPVIAASPLFPFVMAIAVLGLTIGVHEVGKRVERMKETPRNSALS